MLVIAPHCDDEVLACAGLIQRTIRTGGTVATIVVTNGDGYPSAVARQQRVVHAQPTDFVHFAELRQTESEKALHSLGVTDSNVWFLGYPDGGMLTLWSKHWNHNLPYRSRFTMANHSPYSRTYSPSSNYCGADAAADIAQAIRVFKPTLIVAAHPAEDHTDHATVGALAELAWQMVETDPTCKSWISSTSIRHYVVHRGDWPMPQGLHRHLPLSPPAAMSNLDTDWSQLQLTSSEESAKQRAIALYQSQTAVMPAFMDAFVRTNELYGEIPTRVLPAVADSETRANGTLKSWQKIVPVMMDPARDNVIRDLQGGADILALSAATSGSRLHLLLHTRRPVHAGVTARIHVRCFDAHWRSSDVEYVCLVKPRGQSGGAQLEKSVTWHDLGQTSHPFAIALWANTEVAGVEVDRTEIRTIPLHGVLKP